MTYREALIKANKLLQNNIDSPNLDAVLLLAFTLKKNKEYIYTWPDKNLNLKEENIFFSFINQRIQGKPLAYIIQEKEFYGLKFYVNPYVLIPRPETELIIDQVKKLFSFEQKFTFCDLGTGSGCLGISLVNNFPLSKGILVDCSYPALKIAKKNANRHKALNHLALVQTNMTKLHFSKKIDLLISNPPYISYKEAQDLPPEVKSEPQIALIGGKTGLLFYPFLAKLAKYCLKPKGKLIAEFGATQTEYIKKIFAKFSKITIHKDLAGLDRIIVVEK
ncbi:release factor glutamine methyltransferase [Desulfonauticus submarinus]|uniref:Release factor glutamine methyltransferase n=1 Tax=Desulfonauticus submarinus TaxID=206665 RepID=A0A1H0BCN9_9BACT|nr:peptide chain release factor N(5)-glutamine methyltransferase [Desulfonauticus submarinus]SDN43399.1 release factor glutamine methyltransferase [Desulfonauticus submarinus]